MSKKFKVVLEFKVTDQDTFEANKGQAQAALTQFLNAGSLATVGLALKSQKIDN